MEKVIGVDKSKWTKFTSLIDLVPTEKVLEIYRKLKVDNYVGAEKVVEEETSKIQKTKGADKIA